MTRFFAISRVLSIQLSRHVARQLSGRVPGQQLRLYRRIQGIQPQPQQRSTQAPVEQINEDRNRAISLRQRVAAIRATNVLFRIISHRELSRMLVHR